VGLILQVMSACVVTDATTPAPARIVHGLTAPVTFRGCERAATQGEAAPRIRGGTL
jgi:hypothetical protein